MKYILVGLLYFLSLAKLSAQEIKIYTWEGYLSEDVVNAFTEKTGHTVRQYFYDSEIDRNAVLMNGTGERYDLILADNMTTLSYGKLGALYPLAAAKIANTEYNGQQWQDTCGKYGIPYAKGTMGIIHRTSVSKTKITSWNDLLTPPEEHIGTTMMLKDAVDTIAIALLAQSRDPFTRNKEELKSAYLALRAQSKYLLKYGNPLTYTLEHGKNSALTLAAIYSGDLQNIKKSTGQSDWEYVVPKEGTLFYVDCFTAPSGTRLKAASKAFLSYINEPAVAYKNARDVWFSTTNDAALLIADAKYKNDSDIFPDAAILQRSKNYKLLAKEEMVLRNRISSLLNIQE